MIKARRSASLVCVLVAGSLTLLLFTVPSLAESRSPARKSSAVIACFHPKTRHYTAQAHPSRCYLRGHGEGRVVGIPVKGMRWGHWGAKSTRAAYGVNERSGARVRVIASHPITCEGRAWYSRVIVVTLRDGNFFGLLPPTCDERP